MFDALFNQVLTSHTSEYFPYSELEVFVVNQLFQIAVVYIVIHMFQVDLSSSFVQTAD